jgi:predicted ATPase
MTLPQLDGNDTEGRFRFFEAVTELLRAEAGRTPLMLVLDDLQAADEESLLLLEFVASEVAEMPALILALAREDTPRLDELARVATRMLQLGS